MTLIRIFVTRGVTEYPLFLVEAQPHTKYSIGVGIPLKPQQLELHECPVSTYDQEVPLVQYIY
jgi:hypothetical protein